MIVNAKQKFNEFQKLFTQNKQNLNEYDDEIKDAIKMIKSTLAQISLRNVFKLDKLDKF